MDIERAIEILDPEHRERYDSIETVDEACRMGREALRWQLAAQEGDSISRELAIKALHDKIVKNRIYCPEDDGLDEFETEEVLRKLPSVSLRPIVWPVRWIPVEERMPETDKLVLVVMSDGDMAVAWWNAALGWLHWWSGFCVRNVTHWMPLPEPPDCGGKDGGMKMEKYIKLQDAIDAGLDFVDFYCGHPEAPGAMIKHMESVPVADVVEVRAVILRMIEERKRAKGNWHTDPYWLGWVDAMGRAQRIVDGTIDNEPVYAPSTGEKMETEK